MGKYFDFLFFSEKKMFAMDDEDEEWNDEDDQTQGYQALLDPDDDE